MYKDLRINGLRNLLTLGFLMLVLCHNGEACAEGRIAGSLQLDGGSSHAKQLRNRYGSSPTHWIYEGAIGYQCDDSIYLSPRFSLAFRRNRIADSSFMYSPKTVVQWEDTLLKVGFPIQTESANLFVDMGVGQGKVSDYRRPTDLDGLDYERGSSFSNTRSAHLELRLSGGDFARDKTSNLYFAVGTNFTTFTVKRATYIHDNANIDDRQLNRDEVLVSTYYGFGFDW